MLEARFIPGVRSAPRVAWDRLASATSPFFEWAFLAACEEASATPEHGVQAQHLTVWDGERLVGALPLYLKGDGRGEFIYDWAWYQFARRVGVDYYPKGISMAPFTPVTGTHFLTDPDYDPAELRAEMAAVVEHWAQANELPAVHYLFVPEAEADWFESQGYLRRLTFQLHWLNEGFSDFAGFLGRFRHKDRNKFKRERRRVQEQGIEFEILRGEGIGEDDLEAMFGFYERTCMLHGTGSNYLKRDTWLQLWREWRERLVLFMARKDGERIGASLCVQKGEDLYGRYWGSSREFPCLYFALAFYEPIELAIAEGYQRFWVGFGNSQTKFARGLRPSPTHSVHRFFDPMLTRVIGQHLAEDREIMRAEIEATDRACKLKPPAATSEG